MLQALPSSVSHLAGASSVSSSQSYFYASWCSFLKSFASGIVYSLCCTFYVLWQRHIGIKAIDSTEVPCGEVSLALWSPHHSSLPPPTPPCRFPLFDLSQVVACLPLDFYMIEPFHCEWSVYQDELKVCAMLVWFLRQGLATQ